MFKSTCRPAKSKKDPVRSDCDRQLFGAALATVTNLITNLEAKISTSHDVQMLVSMVQNREEIIAAQLATISDFQSLVSHHHSLVNLVENQVTTISSLKQQLRKKESVELLLLEKDEHLQQKANKVEVLEKILKRKDEELSVWQKEKRLKAMHTLPVKMADNIDEEGNIITPADHEPHISVVSGSVTPPVDTGNDDASKNSSAIAPLAGSWINLLAKLRSTC